MGALTPRLTRLDEHVLAAVPERVGARRETIVDALRLPVHVGRRDIEQILNGLEHVGRVVNNNGWWRRA